MSTTGTSNTQKRPLDVSDQEAAKEENDNHNNKVAKTVELPLATLPAFYPSSTFLTPAQMQALQATAAKICTFGKGISACDESAGTLGQRFAAVGIANNTAEHRRLYRQLLLTTHGIETYLSAAILDPETLAQCTDNGTPFPAALEQRGIVCGVKPHLKVATLPGTGGDTVMQGLDGLAERCQQYFQAGARFCKWRSPLTIDVCAGRPTDVTIHANMNDLARYALICQANGLVPIVEPDIILQGTHTLAQAVQVNIRVQSALFEAMRAHGVYLPGATLKPNMVNPGLNCPVSYTVQDIGRANVYVLQQSFPVAMPGANFLSGGQDLITAAARLSAMNQILSSSSQQRRSRPWNLSFSWSQALQLPLLELCRDNGGEFTWPEMAALYLKELKIAFQAAQGRYKWNPGDGDHKGNDNTAAE